MIRHKYELYVGQVIGVHEDYMELHFCLNVGHILQNMVVIRYTQVYVDIFEFLKRTYLRLFSNLRFLREVQYVQYNDYAL